MGQQEDPSENCGNNRRCHPWPGSVCCGPSVARSKPLPSRRLLSPSPFRPALLRPPGSGSGPQPVRRQLCGRPWPHLFTHPACQWATSDNGRQSKPAPPVHFSARAPLSDVAHCSSPCSFPALRSQRPFPCSLPAPRREARLEECAVRAGVRARPWARGNLAWHNAYLF